MTRVVDVIEVRPGVWVVTRAGRIVSGPIRNEDDALTVAELYERQEQRS